MTNCAIPKCPKCKIGDIVLFKRGYNDKGPYEMFGCSNNSYGCSTTFFVHPKRYNYEIEGYLSLDQYKALVEKYPDNFLEKETPEATDDNPFSSVKKLMELKRSSNAINASIDPSDFVIQDILKNQLSTYLKENAHNSEADLDEESEI